jgi:hypothetical protein
MDRSTLLKVLFAVVLVGSLGFEFLGEKSDPVHPWDYPLFFAMAGAVGCIALSVVAKGIVSPVLDRDQDFYESDAREYDEIAEQFAAREDAPAGSSTTNGEG